MTRKKVHIEEMLEQIGSQEICDDNLHRYRLRRALLCSKYFEDSRKKTRWNIVFSYGAPLLAGTVVVGMFAFMATSLPSSEVTFIESTSSEVHVAVDADSVHEAASVSVVEPSLSASAFVSNPSEPLVQLADFNEQTSQNTVRFIPITPRASALVR